MTRITPRNLRYHELVGLRARVAKHPDPGVEGLEGVIAWETARTITLRVKGRDRVILKAGGVFIIHLPGGGEAVVRGEEIAGAPWERARRVR